MTAYDEMFAADGSVRPRYREFAAWLAQQSAETMRNKRAEADLVFRRVGITFAVYGDHDDGTARLIPFDVIPRIVPADEWRAIEAGLRQRVRALNLFLHDVHHDQNIVRAGRVPAERVFKNAQYRPEMHGVDVVGGVYAHIAGVDLVRAGDGALYVLEGSLRVPSGVSYMLENRQMMMRLFPELFTRVAVAPVAHYPDLLLENLRSVAPPGVDDPTVVLLTPGVYNAAYFEHAFLAQQMGIELVEGQDLFVQDDATHMRTTRGPQRVDVIYRRIDDDFLDPLAFRPDSSLGVPGLLSVCRAGRVALANAIGTGVADDKSIYPYVPAMIEFYLGEKPLLASVPTHLCRDREGLAYTLAHLSELVVKEVHGAGGYGMLIGPAATAREREEFAARIRANLEKYVAQPTLALSTCPTVFTRRARRGRASGGDRRMTYCVALRLDAGLVFLSDSRTNAGVDQISTFRKMTVFEHPGERLLVLLSAGNLAITQAVRQVVCEHTGPHDRSVWNATAMLDAVQVVGEAVREVHARDAKALREFGIDFNCNFIFGGQIRGEAPRLFQVYAAGNFIEATPENPYFQIGEAKYGKPIIDRVLKPDRALDEAAKLALISMDSTLRSNISVGMPLHLLVYERDALRVTRFVQIDHNNPYMQMIRSTWGERIKQVFLEIPDPLWRDSPAHAGAPRLQAEPMNPVRAPLPASLEGGAQPPAAPTAAR